MLPGAAVFLPAGRARGGHRPQGQALERGRGTPTPTQTKHIQARAFQGTFLAQWAALPRFPNPQPSCLRCGPEACACVPGLPGGA
eukprot:12958079-Alexandrium_andersonii.AAC.1